MNLIFTITSYPPAIGGAQLYTALLARHLALRNEVGVISLWDNNRTDWLLGTTLRAYPMDFRYLEGGIPVNRLGFSMGEKIRMAPFAASYYFWMGLAIPGIARILEEKILPLVKTAEIIHNVRIGREPLSFASFATARKLNVPFVFTPLHHPRWSGWLYRYYHKLYREADAVTALTNVEKEILKGFGVKEDRIFVTGMGPILAEAANPEKFRADHSLGENPMVLFLGQKYQYKGVKALLEAARLVWARFPDTIFVFIGPRTEYSEKLFPQHQDRRIIELGKVDLQTKTDALAACNILCVPSEQESFGGVYTEAWSFGKPVIGCDIPAVSEVIDHQENGLLTSQKPEMIADYIIQLLSDETLAKKMGGSGKQKVDENFSWEKIASRTLQAYTFALTGK